jgi:hypothetical protein
MSTLTNETVYCAFSSEIPENCARVAGVIYPLRFVLGRNGGTRRGVQCSDTTEPATFCPVSYGRTALLCGRIPVAGCLGRGCECNPVSTGCQC